MTKSPAARRPFPPGQHGAKVTGKKKETNYGRHLLEKQKLRTTYAMGERQFRNTFKKAARVRGASGETFLSMLESRLDSVVYRAGFAPTVWAARQLVCHGHITVDGKKVDVASYAVKPKQVVAVKEKSRNMEMIKKSLESSTSLPPLPYLEVFAAAFECKLREMPNSKDIPVRINTALVVEFYSK